MRLSTLRPSNASRVLQSALVFTGGFIAGAALTGGAFDAARMSLRSLAPVSHAEDGRCGGGNEVSAFVCRNTWASQTRYGVR